MEQDAGPSCTASCNLAIFDDELDGEAGKDEKNGRQEEDQFKGPQFYPRLYKQRYDKASDYIYTFGSKLQKVVDFGCAECRYLRRARKALPYARYLVGVDIDASLLREHVEELEIRDDREEDYFYTHRPRPLTTELYQGDMTVFDRRLADVDAVTCIEIIEHLEPEILENVPEVIFGQYRPFCAVITTPNSEYNVCFDMGERKFRHWDHKFEWTRQEFQEWCAEIVKRYPDYSVNFDGCGNPPEDMEKDVGYCSQIATFRRRSWEEYLSVVKEKEKIAKIGRQNPSEEPYEEIDINEFPFDKTARIANKLLSAVERCCSNVAAEEENIQKLKRDADGKILYPEEDDDENSEKLKTMWEAMADEHECDKAENPVVEEIVGHRLGVFIPMARIMEDPGVNKLCEDKSEVVAFLVGRDWTYDFFLNRLFYPLEDLGYSEDDNEIESEEDYGFDEEYLVHEKICVENAES